MALATFLTELQLEASCPVCLDHLRDPVTLNCGHNCCESCLHQHWQGLQDILPCPVCLYHCPSRDARRNPQLSLLTDLLRQLLPTSSQGKRQEEEALCAQHHQVLALFCEEDLELLCAQCGASSPHQGHPLTSLEQAAAQHREKLKSSLEPLRKQVEDAERALAMQVSTMHELREKVETRRSELYFEFAKFKLFLEKGQDVIDNQILWEMSGIYQIVIESRNQMSDYGSTLKSLLREISTQCVQTDLGLLRGIGSLYLQWINCANLKTPAAYSWKSLKERFSLAPHSCSLKTITDKFQVDLTLDPETAHHNLIISQDRKTITFTYERMSQNYDAHPKAFTSHEAVLSTQGFEAGRHFWQVDIRGTGVWSLGVCKESFLTNALTPPSPSNGCWQFLQSTGRNIDPYTVCVQVGVFLDYELGEISFYNLSTRSHLCTLRDTFTDRLIPYFSVGPSSLSFSMTLITDKS